jgi:regulator of RNase E activity RraA
VVPNDVIVVENEIGQYAYFGELNANLAIRRGAAGVVVGGMTRDSADVVRLCLPVFAQGYSCQDVRMLGRAKTLRLRRLEDGEDFRGIYKALDSYATVVPNDVIVVENEIGQYAYFGELNANLAIRRGAAGVVVGGMTRDSADVVRLGLPVFAQGYSCQDVRKRATLDSVNKPVTINGVRVAPEDLVFGDREGLVVIPRRVEASVLDAALRVATNEKRILIDISEGAEVERLTREYGIF